ncbi:MAG: F0F1 ATP synthase subunit delta [bacterium]|nr:F0F1 ATP synthase subunit delta [bacterium]
MENFNCINNLLTVSDLDQLRSELGLLKDDVFTSKEIDIDTIVSSLTEDNANMFLADLNVGNVDLKSKDQFISFINEILDKLEKVTKVSLIFAIRPTLSNINKIQSMLQGEGKQVYEYKVDSNIYGGVVIMKDGLSYDYSIKSKVEELI